MKDSEARSTRQRWVNLVQQQEHSGQAVKVFCREHGVSEPSFYGWRKRLKASHAVRFALVEAGVPAAMDSAPIELVLASGNCLRIAPGADAATLRVLQGPA